MYIPANGVSSHVHTYLPSLADDEFTLYIPKGGVVNSMLPLVIVDNVMF